jgi:hypothetical protein
MVLNFSQSIGTVNQFDLTSMKTPGPQGRLVMHKLFHQLAIILSALFGLTAALPAMSQDRWHPASYVMSDVRGFYANGPAPNALHTTLSGEVTKRIDLALVKVHPLAEAQFGVEAIARFEPDISVGGRDADQLRLYDVTTGQIHKSSDGSVHLDVEFMLGVDVGRVLSSQYLPISDGYVVEPVRFRDQAGMSSSGSQEDTFYDVTWFGPGFEDQSNGQAIGFLNVNLRF